MHFKKRVLKMGLDTSHFNPHWNNTNNEKKMALKTKLKSEDILIKNRLNRRENVLKLRRALLEYGVEEKCQECEIKDWKDKKLILQIDHIDGDYLNNEVTNLKFLCPNCHSQTDNYGYKGK